MIHVKSLLVGLAMRLVHGLMIAVGFLFEECCCSYASQFSPARNVVEREVGHSDGEVKKNQGEFESLREESLPFDVRLTMIQVVSPLCWINGQTY